MNDFYFLQFINYFASRGFVQVSLVSSLDGKKVNDQSAWMLSASQDRYSVIRISNDNQFVRQEKIEYLKVGFEKMKEIFNADNARMLDISLNVDGGDFKDEEIDFITLTADKQLDSDVLKQFPDIMDVFKIQQSENFDAEKLKTSIDKKTIANRSSFLKNRIKRKTPLTFTIVGTICLVLFIVAMIIEYAFETSDVTVAVACGAYYKAFISALNQYYRFLTSGFIHVSIYHLICNMYSLLSLSRISEKEFGFAKTIIILLVSIVFGSAFVFIGQDNIVCLGISGGLYGLLGAITVVFLNKGYFKDRDILRSFIRTFAINVLISIMPNVSFLAHLGGFVAGLFLGAILSDDTQKNLKTHAIICGCAVLIATVVACYLRRDFNNIYFGTDTLVMELYNKLHLVNNPSKVLTKLINYYGG